MYREAPISLEIHQEWMSKALSDPLRYYWIILVDDTPFGLANLYDISEEDQACSWAFYLGDPETRGRGLGSAVEYLVLREVFEERGFNRLACEVLARNKAVVTLHEAVGFQREGQQRQRIKKPDGYQDVVLLSLLASEWPDAKARLRTRLHTKGVDVDTPARRASQGS